jgi:hypothetical protein
MKTSMVVFATVLAISGAGFAQEKAAPSRQEAIVASGKPLTVFGMVSNDGKTLLTDIDSEWAVSNADALKGHEGRLVTLKCYVDTAKNQLHVLTVRRANSELYFAFRQADSGNHDRLDPR